MTTKNSSSNQSMVPLHWDSHFLENVLLLLGQKPQRTPKMMPFWSCLWLGLEYHRPDTWFVSKTGTGLTKSNILYYHSTCRIMLAGTKNFIFGTICKIWNINTCKKSPTCRALSKVFEKNAWFLGLFGAILGILVVMVAAQIILHVCIAHVIPFTILSTV